MALSKACQLHCWLAKGPLSADRTSQRGFPSLQGCIRSPDCADLAAEGVEDKVLFEPNGTGKHPPQVLSVGGNLESVGGMTGISSLAMGAMTSSRSPLIGAVSYCLNPVRLPEPTRRVLRSGIPRRVHPVVVTSKRPEALSNRELGKVLDCSEGQRRSCSGRPECEWRSSGFASMRCCPAVDSFAADLAQCRARGGQMRCGRISR